MRKHTAKLTTTTELWCGDDNERMYIKLKDDKGNSVLLYVSANLKAAKDAKRMFEANFTEEGE